MRIHKATCHLCLLVSPILTTSSVVLTQSPVFEIDGPVQADYGISAAASVGDVDRDGIEDFALGYENADTSAGRDTGLVQVHSGRDGRVLFNFVGSPLSLFAARYGLAGVGDVNRDGYPDIAVGAPTDSRKVSAGGSVTVFSGKDGTVLRLWQTSHLGAFMGRSVAGIGDINRDGHNDVLVGFLVGRSYPVPRGEAQVLSGKDGSIVHRISDPNGNAFASRVAAAGDVDGDGTPDFYVSSWPGDYVYAYSGKSGKRIRTYSHPTAKYFSFPEIVSVGDVDKDGVPDIGIGDGSDSTAGVNAGACFVFSNKTGKLLHTIRGVANDYMGHITGLGDVDGDGHADFAVSGCQCYVGSQQTGYVKGYSGKTGALLFTARGVQANGGFGFPLARTGDLTGDGISEILVGHVGFYIGSQLRGHTTVLSPKSLALTADRYRISRQNPGTQFLSIDFGSQHGGQPYWVFGSFTGTRPGTPIGAWTVPLNFDAYTLFTIGNPTATPFLSFTGRLNARGQARAGLTVPNGLPVPFTLFHACVTFDNAGTVRAVSNAVSLRID